MAAVQSGNELLLNNIKTGDQYRPAIAATAIGGFVAAWQDTSLSGQQNQDDIRFARFDAFGSRLTGAIDTQAVTNAIGSQSNPSIATFNDGKFVIAWTDANGTQPDIFDRAVRFQIFNFDGTTSGTAKIVNTTYPGSQDQQSISVLSNGNIVVVWSSEIQAQSGARDIIRRVFDSSGNPITGEQTVNMQTVGDQTNPTVHPLSASGFVVAWQDDEDGPAAGNAFKTFFRFYNDNGTSLDDPIRLDTTGSVTPKSVDFAELANGNIAVLWTEESFTGPGDGSGATVRLRIYNPVLEIFGAAIQVNTTTSNDQTDARIAALGDGQFVVVWSDKSNTAPDDSFGAVRMQVFNASGGKVGAEILVNDQVNFEQANPVITVLKDGRFVVAWEDRNQTIGDLEGYGVRSQIFDARIAAVTVNGTALADTYQGSSFGDTINGLAGNDIIKGGDGIDVIAGGIGLDTIFGESGNDSINGGSNNDDIDGGIGNDSIDGGIGNDKLTGGTGNDTLIGGTGDDTYYVDSATDVVTELPNQGNDKIFASVSYTIAANVEVLELSGSSNINGAGRDTSADILFGNSGINTLTGFGGNDTFYGQSGADVLNAGNGDDALYGGLGGDVLNGGDGTDLARYDDAAFGNLVINMSNIAANTLAAAGDSYVSIEGIVGGSGNDTITGNTLRNSLYGFGGTDALNGGDESDNLWGGTGADTLNGGNGFDFARYDGTPSVPVTIISLSAPGINTGEAAGDSFVSIEGIIGSSGADRITGNASDNSLVGQDGADRLDGKAGLDTLFGSAGSDTFMFTTLLAASGADRIDDFKTGEDKIYLLPSIFSAIGSTLSAFEFRTAAKAIDSNDFIIYDKTKGTLAYDFDGSGISAKQVFARLVPGTALSVSDFTLTLV